MHATCPAHLIFDMCMHMHIYRHRINRELVKSTQRAQIPLKNGWDEKKLCLFLLILLQWRNLTIKHAKCILRA